MGAVVIVGAQWGDEGKGKIVDIYAEHAELVVRYAGGANAGHTLVVDGEKLVFHLMPSGALRESAHSVLGHGTVIDPAVLLDEIEQLSRRGRFAPSRLTVSDRAHVVLPHHKLVDNLREGHAGASSIGTTKRGIGPAYEDKVARRGIRVGDLSSETKLREKLQALLSAWAPTIHALGGTLPNPEETVAIYLDFGRRLTPCVGSSSDLVFEAIRAGRKVLMEGAQGALLDVDTGTYPFVTSSSTVSGGACIGAGIGPTMIGSVVGIAKAYSTRVGNGPFPTEQEGPVGEMLRTAGAEFGATTGRPRRCGWLDLPALRQAVRTNGLSGLALTKIDVLTGMKEIQICTGYRLGERVLDIPPYDGLSEVEPVYETLPGWDETLTDCKRLTDLPAAARRYVERIEQACECPIWLVSVGPDREQTIIVHDPFAN